MIQDDLLLHSYKDGRARFNAYLDDYANFASGLISLYESTGVTRWLQAAIKIANKMIEEFWDDAEGGFFYTGASHEQLIVRTKDYFDNATPSGNSVAADALLRLAALTDNEDYRRRAVTIFRLLRASLQRYPSAFGQLLSALDFHLSTPKEIAIVRVSNADDAREMMRAAWQLYLPNKIVACAAETDAEAIKLIPLLRERFAIDGRPTAYVCVNRSCQLPPEQRRNWQRSSPRATTGRRTRALAVRVLSDGLTQSFEQRFAVARDFRFAETVHGRERVNGRRLFLSEMMQSSVRADHVCRNARCEGLLQAPFFEF